MERAEVLQAVQDTAVHLLDLEPEQVHEGAAFADLGVDSLSFIELVMELEDRLGVELPEQPAAAAATVGALVDLVLTR